MISGVLMISIAFVAAAVAAVAYWLYYRDGDIRFNGVANSAFYISGAAILCAGFLLYYNIFTHNFQLNYVYSYTSLKLSAYYLISTFWAGQEGTFLLWLIFGVFYGLVLIKSVGRKQPLVLFYFMLVQVFLLLILLKKSPFAMIWHAHAEVPIGFTPADGASLNPLLQNPWMIIHPPIMFMGYSSTVIAFAFALRAMTLKDFAGWVKEARPWVLFANLMLGTGIVLGGYWSYVTLGWGGYWAWDPVENASLVPWLFSIVLLHGIIIQIRQKGLVKTNLTMAGLAFISVLWGSFLTRSGVLADFSVHSFGASDLNLYLIALVSFFTILFVYLFFKSTSGEKGSKFAEGILSRETFILVGMISVLLSGLAVFIATASPIYTGLIGEPANVGQSFYNIISIPIAIFILLSMAIAPVLTWRVSELREVKTVLISVISALVITVAGIFFGLTKPVSVVLVFLSLFAVVLNSIVLFKFMQKHPGKTGGYLTHIGFALMIVGIITSSMYDTSEKVTLPTGEFTKTDFGYDIKFSHFVNSPDGKDYAKMLVKTKNGQFEANPQFYFSEYTKSYMLSPHVDMGILKDIYISPISYMPGKAAPGKQLILKKEETKKLGDISVTFDAFEIGDHSENNAMVVKAKLTVVNGAGGKKQQIAPAMTFSEGKRLGEAVVLPGSDYGFQLQKVDANDGSIVLAVTTPGSGAAPKDILAIQVSEKPLISVLWLGTIIMMIGMVAALYDRIKMARNAA